MSLRKISLIGILSAIIVILEISLIGLANIQLSFFLIILYSKNLSLKDNLIIIFIYLFLDALLMSSLNILYFTFMFSALSIIPITLKTIFKNINDERIFASITILYSTIYSLSFVIPTIIITEIDLLTYLIADIPFTIILAVSNFLAVLYLYKPVNKIFQKQIKNYLRQKSA